MKGRREAGWRVFRIRVRLWERLRRLHTPTGEGSPPEESTGRPRRGARGKALATLLLAFTLDMSAAEFAALQRLPDEARRDRLGMAATCAPGLTAMKGGGAGGDRLTVLVDCKPAARLGQLPAKLLPPR